MNYRYTKFFESAKYGTPVMRALFMEFPEIEQATFYNEQYMFGDVFMIKPDELDYTDMPM